MARRKPSPGKTTSVKRSSIKRGAGVGDEEKRSAQVDETHDQASKSSSTVKSSSTEDSSTESDASARTHVVQGATRFLPLIAILHLVALAISYLAIVGPSQTHSSALSTAAPYLRSTHFAADGRRFYLAHGTPDEQPHRLQYTTIAANQPIDSTTEWKTVKPSGIPGLASSDRYQRWMILAATLAESDQPSLAAALLLPLVQQDESISAIRVVRLPTELTTAADDSLPPPYLARVVRGEGQIRLVSIQSGRLTTSRREDVSSTRDGNNE